MTVSNRVNAGNFRPIKDNVFVSDLDRGPRLTKGGIIIPDDDGKDQGIRDRWGKVYAVGPDVTDLKPGDWVLVKHGRWTPGFDLALPEGTVRLWRIDYPESVLLASDTDPRSAQPTTL